MFLRHVAGRWHDASGARVGKRRRKWTESARRGVGTWPDMSAEGSSGGGTTPTSVASATSGIEAMAQSMPTGTHAVKEAPASGVVTADARARKRGHGGGGGATQGDGRGGSWNICVHRSHLSAC